MIRKKNSAAMVCFSAGGKETAVGLQQKALEQQKTPFADTIRRDCICAIAEATVYVPARVAVSAEASALQGYEKLSKVMEVLFDSCDVIFCFGAAGIAVRSIAPYLDSKYTDPAVVVCDEAGRYAVSLLSGHVGQANRYAEAAAALLSGEAVITTASDTGGVFAVDAWAKEQHLVISSHSTASVKAITTRLLQGASVGFASSYPHRGDLPRGLTEESAKLQIAVGDMVAEFDTPVLQLLPQNYVLGIGCKKGTSAEDIQSAWEQLAALLLSQGCISCAADLQQRIRAVASMDRKATEAGLLQWAHKNKAELFFFTAEELKAAAGDFAPSPFVSTVTGVDNVCQRAAALAAELLAAEDVENYSRGSEVRRKDLPRCVLPKQKFTGVTMALYELPPRTLQF